MIKRRVIASRRPDTTRRRILEGAGRLFAAEGYHAVGFRDMAQAAGVSLRMPHHYFGSKRKLFAECVRYALVDRINLAALFTEPPPAGDRRRAKAAVARSIRTCFHAIHPRSGRPSWSGDLIGRALTENLDESLAALQDGLKPARDWFYPALRILRPDMNPQAYVLWYVSLWAQISFYVTARPAILARLGRKNYSRAFLETAADHLVHVMLKQLED